MLEVFFDGACWPNTLDGHMSYGFVVKDKDVLIHSECKAFSKSTPASNNKAEYAAAYYAMDWLLANGKADQRIIMFGDSLLVIDQLSGKKQLGHGIYAATGKKTLDKVKQFKDIQFQWIRRALNHEADALSAKALLDKGIERPFYG